MPLRSILLTRFFNSDFVPSRPSISDYGISAAWSIITVFEMLLFAVSAGICFVFSCVCIQFAL